ncbi:hypothetical protein [Halobacterium bonnevillei]|uniref:DUF4149 domain-containing protein n=1 Tax=Halobacterium bonnevillei TaxID=2692200 RepID=A0A6B0SFG9_9EURY|nr:hypothetical protein [Halobacterium bonnevillei]MXR19376.1 hypothetical protein [Halobacterium bonnevillei]
MTLLSTVLFVVGAVHLAAAVPILLAPGRVRDALPRRYAEAVGGRRAWRGFGAGVASIGISTVLIASALGA